MLMILARLVRSESFWAVVKVRSPHNRPEVWYPRPVVVDAETVDNFTACLLRSLTERELRERFLGGQWSTIHNASNIVYQRDRCESCGSGLFN